MNDKYLDCVVIGYNELPFERYENFLRNYGEDSEAYRDLKFSFVNLGDKKLFTHFVARSWGSLSWRVGRAHKKPQLPLR